MHLTQKRDSENCLDNWAANAMSFLPLQSARVTISDVWNDRKEFGARRVLPHKTLSARLAAQAVVLIEPYYVKSVVNKSTVYTPSVIVNIRSNTKLPSF